MTKGYFAAREQVDRSPTWRARSTTGKSAAAAGAKSLRVETRFRPKYLSVVLIRKVCSSSGSRSKGGHVTRSRSPHLACDDNATTADAAASQGHDLRPTPPA